ncbi:MAG TPA: quinone-dependent dihydroorotate dehydrogenase [Rhizomicrobium sp.]|jgi:dihydroorotate dehydrogenase|nr:quinone-dependent dihydroorotate dehydrogenase [Rhizomicrobium sp.]
MIFDLSAAALRLLPPETAHRATIGLLSIGGGILPPAQPHDSQLALHVLGQNFPNPLGLAAGFDKNAQAPDAMLNLGFGFVECGTVTPRPQAGNARPRLFRLSEDGAVINRMGFNNQGMERVAARLARRKRRGILGINIGANKDSADRIADYRAAFARLAPLADYVTINISSPNTPGLRGLQNRDELERLVNAVLEERSTANLSLPVLIKIAPDLDSEAMDGIAQVTLAAGVEGLIVSNTTIARPANLRSADARQAGGLSGRPLFEPSTQVLREIRARVGARMVLIGVGGVRSGTDAYAKIRAGASLVQLYTALTYDGPGLITRIKRELLECLVRDGFARVADAVGADAN